MDDKLKKRWIKALRSGKYKQGSGRLQEDGKFCCLGVLCELMPKDFEWRGTRYLDLKYNAENLGSFDELRVHELGLDKKVIDDGDQITLQSKLINMNDNYKKDFNQIANYLERINI
jgi:hypothetical protein